MTEPLFGVYGRLDREPDGRLLCHLCGRAYRSLAQHARLAHGVRADEYRALAGLNRQTRLMDEARREQLRATSAPVIARLRAEGKLRNWGEDRTRFARDKAAAVATLQGGLAPEHARHEREGWTPERRRQRASETAARNRAGTLRADPATIGAARRRHYAEHPVALAAAADHARAIGAARRRLDDHTVAMAAARYQAGEGLDGLARAYGVAYGTIRRELLAAGVALRARGSRPQQERSG